MDKNTDKPKLPKHIVRESDLKDCKSCKHYDHLGIGCDHKYWNMCIVRDSDEIVIDYKYYEPHYR